MEPSSSTIETITTLLKDESFKQAITLATQKDWVDIVASLAPIIIAIVGMALTYKSINSRVREVHHEHAAIKTLERFYEASDLYFEYIDSQKLFISMIEKKAIRAIEGRDLDEHFNNKYEDAEGDSYQTIKSINRAKFIFETLDHNELSQDIERLHKYVIENRRSLILSLDNEEYTTIKESARQTKIDLKVRFITLSNEIMRAMKTYIEKGSKG